MAKNEVQQMTLMPEEPPAKAFQEVPLDQIKVDAPYVVTGPKWAAFVENIYSLGVLEPVILEQTNDSQQPYRMIEGRKRFRAAQDCRLDSIPAMIVELTGWEAGANVIGLSANEQRYENPLSTLQAIDELLKTGASFDAISEATGLPVPKIDRYTRLHNLIPELWNALKAGTLPITVAFRCASCTKEQQRELAFLLDENGTIGAADVRSVTSGQTTPEQSSILDEVGDKQWYEVVSERLVQAITFLPTERPVNSAAAFVFEMCNSALERLQAEYERTADEKEVSPSAVTEEKEAVRTS